MTKNLTLMTALVTAAPIALATAADAQSREQVQVVGSSTVYPFTTTVAENFGRDSDFQAPVIESTGTGGGFQLFCQGVGASNPDINNASRAITQSETDTCAQNGVESITEIQIGNDGIVLATAAGSEELEVSLGQIWQALAAETVGPDGEIVENPYTNWSDIDDSLPDQQIVVFGPPTTSGTRDAFVELALEAGCEEFDAVTSLEEDRMEEVCTTMRSDDAFIEAGENDNVIVQRLNEQEGSYGIFGFSYFDQNRNTLQAASISGATPSIEAIANEEYPLSRPLFIYVKDAHVGTIPGLKEFVDYYTSAESFGPDGFLVEEGLIPLDEQRRSEVQEKVDQLGS